MTSEVSTLDELDRQILYRLMAGWQTTEQTKSAGVVHLADLAATIGVAADELHGRLMLLESLGYVEGVHSFGGDPTLGYKGIDEDNGRSDGPAGDLAQLNNPAYFIIDGGKRAVFAEMTAAGESAATT